MHGQNHFKFKNLVSKTQKKMTNLQNISSNIEELDILGDLMLRFRCSLPSHSTTVYSPSRWNATQCPLEPMLFLLDGEALQ